MIGLVSSIFGQHLSFYSVHPICNILGAQDAHLETLTLTLALNKVWNRLHQPVALIQLLILFFTWTWIFFRCGEFGRIGLVF
ncbi:hypothetical protein GLOIN_2v1886488 [Rhizophagus irregularis DAOM 181602=DAOM 197198]|nr:hypothetical protein GLOIN_2v1886488 [Rhizophagus irregularis DAOM 181602=DAOM 197198]